MMTTDSWSAGPSLNTPRFNSSLVADETLYVAGGASAAGIYDETIKLTLLVIPGRLWAIYHLQFMQVMP